jgi:putative tryptophan/tyrosine transport system substrate-binding protein
VKRRSLLLAGLPLPMLGVRAQQPNLPQVGVLTPWRAPSPQIPTYGALEAGLAEGGWIDGRTVAIEWRHGGGERDRLEGIAAELVRLRVDALYAPGALEVAAARRATTTIPIVGVDLVSDPVQLGYAASLARPSGNLTGIYLDGPGLLGKQLELLRAAVPDLQRVAIIGVDGINNAQMPLAARAGQQLGLTLLPLLIDQPAKLDAAFADAVRQKGKAVLLLPSPWVSTTDMARLVATHSQPVITVFPHGARSGALMAYGPDIRDMWRRAALQTARILKGEPVATMPIERPDRFRFVLNARTAATLGLTLPPTLRLLADEVVE